MPIPNLSDQLAGRDLGVGIPAWTGTPQYTSPNYTPNLLKTGVLIHYVGTGGAHIPTLIGNVDVTRNPVEISVQQLVNGRVTTICNVKYDDQTFAQGSWHFPSDG